MRIKNENMISKLDGVDMTSNIVSEPIWLAHIANYAIQVVFTGAPDGTFKLQASNDLSDPKDPSITNWTDITGSSQIIAASGDYMWTVSNAGYNWVRVVWTDSASGASTITVCRAMVKGV